MTRIHTLIALLTLSMCGCGSPKTVEISGEVSYDGQAVEKGEISFIPADGSSPADAAPIENGRYTMNVKPGTKRVAIRGSRPLPAERQSSPEMGLLYEDFIPARYNDQTTLAAEVAAGGDRVFDFHLTPP